MLLDFAAQIQAFTHKINRLITVPEDKKPEPPEDPIRWVFILLTATLSFANTTRLDWMDAFS